MTTQTTQATQSCVFAPHLKDALSTMDDGKYGRLFPGLTPHQADEAALMALGRVGSAMDLDINLESSATGHDNPRIPSGFTYLGQFIAHDITADRSLLQLHANIDELRNFRTPSLDLELVYASGPAGSPYLYDLDDLDCLLLGLNDAGEPNDLPRNRQGRALIGDPRNDVHLIISQLHVAFLKFHNAVVARLRQQHFPPAGVFDEARRLVRWHYQWIVVNEFLPLTVGDALMDDLLRIGPRYYRVEDRRNLPVEFADAAYRFGHSQIRPLHRINDRVEGTVFPDFAGIRPVPAERVVDWRYLFALDPNRPPQPSMRINTFLAHPLIDLPEAIIGVPDNADYRSLACRDLQRARALDLPSGEELARYMGVTPLSTDDCGLAATGWTGETPLWYYILREADCQADGLHLGEVGGRIVAEVLLGLIQGDAQSYRQDPTWRPTLPARNPGTFTMADLLTFAGVDNLTIDPPNNTN
jgi:Animal haem peroxidase